MGVTKVILTPFLAIIYDKREKDKIDTRSLYWGRIHVCRWDEVTEDWLMREALVRDRLRIMVADIVFMFFQNLSIGNNREAREVEISRKSTDWAYLHRYIRKSTALSHIDNSRSPAKDWRGHRLHRSHSPTLSLTPKLHTWMIHKWLVKRERAVKWDAEYSGLKSLHSQTCKGL